MSCPAPEPIPSIEPEAHNGTTAVGRILVRHLETYGPLSGEDKALLLGTTAELRHVEAGNDLFYEGAPPQGVFVIVEGFACRYQQTRCGSRQITAYLVPGDFCDLDVLLLPTMNHSVGALSHCIVALLAPTTVLDLLERPNLARAMRLATLVETANLREWLVNVGARRAAVRVAHLLCGLHARLRAAGQAESLRFAFPLTQKDLADTIGISTVHMNRTMQELRNAKLIVLRRSYLTILDLPGLEAFAQFEPSYPYLGESAAA